MFPIKGRGGRGGGGLKKTIGMKWVKYSVQCQIYCFQMNFSSIDTILALENVDEYNFPNADLFRMLLEIDLLFRSRVCFSF